MISIFIVSALATPLLSGKEVCPFLLTELSVTQKENADRSKEEVQKVSEKIAFLAQYPDERLNLFLATLSPSDIDFKIVFENFFRHYWRGEDFYFFYFKNPKGVQMVSNLLRKLRLKGVNLNGTFEWKVYPILHDQVHSITDTELLNLHPTIYKLNAADILLIFLLESGMKQIPASDMLTELEFAGVIPRESWEVYQDIAGKLRNDYLQTELAWRHSDSKVRLRPIEAEKSP